MRRRAVVLLPATALLAACGGPPDTTPHLQSADPGRGRQLVVAYGCAACHSFPDIGFPRGGLGPALDGFADQNLIAGRLPNQPGYLMRYIRNAPAYTPQSAMPAVPMSDQDARDVSAYLLTLQSR